MQSKMKEPRIIFLMLFLWIPIGMGAFTFLRGWPEGNFVSVYFANCLVSWLSCLSSIIGLKIFSKIDSFCEASFKFSLGYRKSSLIRLIVSIEMAIPGFFLGVYLCTLSDLTGYRGFDFTNFYHYSVGIVVASIFIAYYYLFESMQNARLKLKDELIVSESRKKEAAIAQMNYLNAQMNPHLLFNSLNTIASMISYDPQNAEKMTLKLAELYRFILKASKEEYHSLADEIALAKDYVAIEKFRLGDRIVVEFENFNEEELKCINVPIMILQPVIENSIKYGIAPKREGGKIVVSIEQIGEFLKIVITDNGLGLKSPVTSTGNGISLKNIENRIKLLYGKEAALSFTSHDHGAKTTILIKKVML